MNVNRAALLADIHGNSPALSAVLNNVKRAGCSRIFVLGDIINGHDPAGCIELLLSTPVSLQALRGNAENYLLTPDLEAFPQRHEPQYASLIRLLKWYKEHLSPAYLSWLSDLPQTIRWDGACLAHDSPLDRLHVEEHYTQGIAEKYQEFSYHSPGIYPDTRKEQLAPLLRWMDAQDISQVYIGHTHVPFISWHGHRLLCNVGSVGLPLDGDPRAVWVLIDESPGKSPSITIQRVEYDIRKIIEIVDSNPEYPDFDQTGMQEAYKRMLETGVHWRYHLREANL